MNEFDDNLIISDSSFPKKKERDIADSYEITPQFVYLGRLINKRHFRGFVFSFCPKGNTVRKLAENYEEFLKYVSTGIWFSSEEELLESKEKAKKKDKQEKSKKDEKEEEADNENYSSEVIDYGSDR